MKRETLASFDKKELSVVYWDEVTSPKAVLQIAHGMAEHMARYDDFALFLNENGYIVAGEDHRAHGQTDREFLGKAEKHSLFDDTVEDLRFLTKHLKQKYNLPVVLMGHSYGSFLAQSYILKGTEDIAAVILMGSALMKGLQLNFGHFFAKGKVKKGRKDEDGVMFANLTFNSYDKKLKQGKNAWLSNDTKQVELYNNDSLCGFICSNGFYHSFFSGLKAIAKADKSYIDKNLKMLIISGEKDPVGGNGKLVIKLYEDYKKAGLKPMLKLCINHRHEVLNELENKQVYADILNYLENI